MFVAAVFFFHAFHAVQHNLVSKMLYILQDYKTGSLIGLYGQVVLPAQRALFITSYVSRVSEEKTLYITLKNACCLVQMMKQLEEGHLLQAELETLWPVGGLRKGCYGVSTTVF